MKRKVALLEVVESRLLPCRGDSENGAVDVGGSSTAGFTVQITC